MEFIHNYKIRLQHLRADTGKHRAQSMDHHMILMRRCSTGPFLQMLHKHIQYTSLLIVLFYFFNHGCGIFTTLTSFTLTNAPAIPFNFPFQCGSGRTIHKQLIQFLHKRRYFCNSGQNYPHQGSFTNCPATGSHLEGSTRSQRNQLNKAFPKLLVRFLLCDFKMQHRQSGIGNTLNFCGIRHLEFLNILVRNADVGTDIDDLKQLILFIQAQPGCLDNSTTGNQGFTHTNFIRNQYPVLTILKQMVDPLHRCTLEILQAVHSFCFHSINIEFCHAQPSFYYFSRNVFLNVS